MLWRSKSNKNRTAHAGVEPAGNSGQQQDPAKPAPQAEQVVSQPGAPQQPGMPEGKGTAGSVPGAPRPTGAPTTAPGPGAPQSHAVDDALKQANRPTREEMLAQMAESEEGRAMLKKLQGLRSSMDSLKKQQAGDPIGAAQRVEQQIHEKQPLQNVQAVQTGTSPELPDAPGAREGVTPAAGKEEIRAAEKAVIKKRRENVSCRSRRSTRKRWKQRSVLRKSVKRQSGNGWKHWRRKKGPRKSLVRKLWRLWKRNVRREKRRKSTRLGASRSRALSGKPQTWRRRKKKPLFLEKQRKSPERRRKNSWNR